MALLRRSDEFRLLYAGQMSSSAGSMISFVAMPYQAYQLTHSSLVVGLLSVAELGPLVATALLGGALADAVDRRRLIRGSQCFLCGTGVMLAVNAAAWHQLWVLFLLAVAGAGLYGLQRPSLEALVPVLVGRDELAAAATLTGLLGNAASLAGPLLGGVLIKLGGLPAAYVTDSAACIISLLAFARMRATPPPPGAARPSLRGVADGLRYARSRPELLGSYLIDISAMLFGAPYAVFPAIAARLGGPAVLGLLYAAPAAGGLIVSMTSGWTRHVSRHGRATVLAVCGWGAGIAAFGFAPGLWWTVAALAAAGAADMVSGIFRMTMWNQTIPAGLRGRLAGLEMISYTTGEPAGNLESGLAAALTGSTRIAIVSGGLACLVGAAAVTLALPALWRYDARNVPAPVRPRLGRPPRCPTCHDIKGMERVFAGGWLVPFHCGLSVVIEQGQCGTDAFEGNDPVHQDGRDGVGTLDPGGGQGRGHGEFHRADTGGGGAESACSGGCGPDQEDLADREADACRSQREGQARHISPPVDQSHSRARVTMDLPSRIRWTDASTVWARL